MSLSKSQYIRGLQCHKSLWLYNHKLELRDKPDDPELDYQNLGSIRNGGEAIDTFAKLHLLRDKAQREQIRADLLAYCRLDTLAMVRIWEKLHDICRNHKI
jgi:hypothetical protein